ncbi:COX15/CtaA family protein [Cellulomonas fimi]|uniref:Cytochrome oxidase assembly n=1 Tax=Cellulomonas fimi (strain ATCC 484 / DSM 20113 / JCM 1341 / CCUG 24087 / LMG 16345 / NBRC 15513 / NCIMB 8980 / NCTC 7547 / NRS-133) TaxID=590998 RepID=F4H8E0_CELFA|nr:COX15/CtaA family protein [Cellulomonas fimi]AEE45821.1 cytochrome oxidase assembly [Cellulomonas fimi ATCC 484]VEH30697.1 Cytochrome oxidase assembly protein [Cellulomonas fimi]
MTTPATAPAAPLLDRLRPRWTRPAIVANLVAQIVIVGTGGAVRLTGSGLGCSTWPECEPGEFTPRFHEATSIHPFIEFGNRTITGVLAVLAIAVALLVFTDRSRSAAYRWLGLAPLAGVAVQAVVGGITVLVDLHPAIVGGHMLISMALVAVSTWLLVRSTEGDAPPVPLVDRTTYALRWLLALLAVAVLVLGVVVTGAGPHSGDEEVGYRFAVDPYAVARLHAASVWLFVAVLVVMLVRVLRAQVGGRTRTVGLVLLAVTLGQGLIGYVQLFTGLPIALVNLHMIGAALLAAGVASFAGTLRSRGRVPVEPGAGTPAAAPLTAA